MAHFYFMQDIIYFFFMVNLLLTSLWNNNKLGSERVAFNNPDFHEAFVLVKDMAAHH